MSTAEKDRVIDDAGFRPNVGIVVTNAEGQVLWGKRVKGRDSWQFPQGGINADEAPEEAMYRELREEIGLLPEHVTILGVTKGWHRYRLPAKYIRKERDPCLCGPEAKMVFTCALMHLTTRCDSTSTRRPNSKTGSG